MNWNLEQLRAFVATVEKGSFSSAARHMGKAQSGVSTSIANLEVDLGLNLFDRSQRYPKLTSQGAEVYRQAKLVLDQCQRLDSTANSAAKGLETRLTVVVDDGVPGEAIEGAFYRLAKTFPDVSLTLHNLKQSDVEARVLEHRADFGVLFQSNQHNAELEWQRVGECGLTVAVSVHHPLAKIPVPSVTDLSAHREISLCSQDGEPFFAPISPNCWYTDDYYYAARMVAKNQGWALLPEHVVQDAKYSEWVVSLSPKALGRAYSFNLASVYRRDSAKGPVMMWLLEQLSSSFSS